MGGWGECDLPQGGEYDFEVGMCWWSWAPIASVMQDCVIVVVARVFNVFWRATFQVHVTTANGLLLPLYSPPSAPISSVLSFLSSFLTFPPCRSPFPSPLPSPPPSLPPFTCRSFDSMNKIVRHMKEVHLMKLSALL